MIFKKKYLLIFFIIIIIQTLLYTNNNQRTSFRFFKWTVQEVSIGKLITFSFFSGLFISMFLDKTNINYEKTFENVEENYEPLKNEEDLKSNIEMPPQRDIRDAQPTISVNYRVVKNADENNSQVEKKYPNSFDNQDDWDSDDSEW